MEGFGGAIKNISIGLGSSERKCLIHTAGESSSSPWGGDQDSFLESLNGLHTLEYVEQIELGSRTYQLISADE